MKYVCCVCHKLVDDPYAVDSDGYYCSIACYKEMFGYDENDETVKELLTETKKHWWNKEE